MRSALFWDLRSVDWYFLTDLYVVHPRCVYAIDGGVVPSNTTELNSVLYWICDDTFRPRKAIFRAIQFTEDSEQI
jgi:hypothetical protein